MKKINLLVLLLCINAVLYSQKPQSPQSAKPVNAYSQVDKIALAMPDSLTKSTQLMAIYLRANLNTDAKIARGIFIWVASNLQYDVDNMFAINFYEKTEDKIARALNTRKGICENYAALFNDLCLKCGLKSFVVEGYTKQNGFADYIPHAWCGAYIDTAWYVFDPTWGSGYVNGGEFYRRINNEYFNALPSRIIKSHMPFDPIWQFLNYPLTNQQFYEGKIQPDKSKPYFNYKDSIEVYEKESEFEQWVSAARRVEANGVKNSLIYDRLNHLKQNIEIYNQTQKVNTQNMAINQYNAAGKEYNDAINDYNAFINYKNNQFTPVIPDGQIRALIDLPKNKLDSSRLHVLQIKNMDDNTRLMMVSLLKSIDEAMQNVNQQEDFVSEYLSKGKSGRRGMFYKTTFFGN